MDSAHGVDSAHGNDGRARSESEADRQLRARQRWHHRLRGRAQVAAPPGLRVPDAAVAEGWRDHSAPGRAPSVLARPDHREVAGRDRDRATLRAGGVPRDPIGERVGGRDLAQPREARIVEPQRLTVHGAVRLEDRVLALERHLRVPDRGDGRADGGVFVHVATGGVDLCIEAEPAHVDRVADPQLPGGLAVAPADGRRVVAGNGRAAHLDAVVPRPAVAHERTGNDRARLGDLGREDLLEVDVGDREALAVLRDPGEDRLIAAEVLDAVLEVGEVETDVPAETWSLDRADVDAELVAPPPDQSQVDDLRAREPFGARDSAVDDRVTSPAVEAGVDQAQS